MYESYIIIINFLYCTIIIINMDNLFDKLKVSMYIKFFYNNDRHN